MASIARGRLRALAPRLRSVPDVSEIDSVPLGAGSDAGHRDTGFSPDSVVVGRSRRMRAVFDFLRVIAGSESNVLIIGETGTGKEVVARLIHHGSGRHGPFVAVSCAILTESLIESELFGHVQGAFTGAIKDRPGRFEMASGGTIFLDDVDDVPPAIQVKLLRVVQERVVERVGGTRRIPVDVRVITGSKRSLRRMVSEGRFREDLFYRLNVIPVCLRRGGDAQYSGAHRHCGEVLQAAGTRSGPYRYGQATAAAAFVAGQRP